VHVRFFRRAFAVGWRGRKRQEEDDLDQSLMRNTSSKSSVITSLE
jgi:hypothetical protein